MKIPLKSIMLTYSAVTVVSHFSLIIISASVLLASFGRWKVVGKSLILDYYTKDEIFSSWLIAHLVDDNVLH